ncbi:unnamed protein product [Cylindrotheca closterium]|uniref:Uncharacterized protein n=1 Tax=Cylindrotheca closterium TaxID=2856 RepID=A0AAD2JGT2_9STRA|nr:unnamed protein product [Cylindrotheca closterium]
MKKRSRPLQTVDEDKVCVAAKVERNEIPYKKKDSRKRGGLSSRTRTTKHDNDNDNDNDKTKNKKKVNKFKDEELNQKYELLPKKARKAPFGRCYFAFHRESKNVVLIAMIFQKVFDQFAQGGRGEDELHKLMKVADPNLRGLREKIQCSGAVALIMDISSNETTTTTSDAAIDQHGSGSTSSDVASNGSKQHAIAKDLKVECASSPSSELNAKTTDHHHESVKEEKGNTPCETGAEETTTQQEEAGQLNTKPSECTRSTSKEEKETGLQETANESPPEPQESYWGSWLMPWTWNKPPSASASTNENLLQKASDREFFQVETSSTGPYDNMKQQKKKTIESKYYQGEAWSVVSQQEYSDCDVASRAALSTTDKTLDSMEAIKGIRVSQISSLDKVDLSILQQNKNESEERDESEEDERRSTRRIDPEGSHKIDPSFSATLKSTDATTEPREAKRTSIAQALDTRRARQKDPNTTTQASKRAWIAEIAEVDEVPETRQLSQEETEETRTAAQDETIKTPIQNETKGVLERDAMSRVSTEYTKDTIYSADYSSVPPYRLMRPKNLTLWGLLCSLELADCMPLGPYDYNVEYDEIFSVGDEEIPNNRWFRQRDTFYSANDSRSAG